jgi:hypothetical protein
MTFFAGFLHMVFPDALILHTMRDPLDTLFRYVVAGAASSLQGCTGSTTHPTASMSAFAVLLFVRSGRRSVTVEAWVQYGVNCV